MTEPLNTSSPKGIVAVVYKKFIRFYLPDILKTGEAREDMMTGNILSNKQLEKIAEKKRILKQ